MTNLDIMDKDTHSSTYQQVSPEYIENLQEYAPGTDMQIHYFGPAREWLECRDQFAGLQRNESGEDHLLLENGIKVRLDRLIAFEGRPGPAFDEYDSYALACLDCMGGMD
jgi:hypothetical protein